MKKRNFIYLSMMALLPIIGCTEDIDLNLNSTAQRLVVEGFLNTDTTKQYIRLTLSGDYYDSQTMPAVTGAQVTITTDDETLLLHEDSAYPGYYFTSDTFFGQQGKTYHLAINNVDVNNDGTSETYTADSYLPTLVKGDSLQIGYNTSWDLWKIMLYAKDPEEMENFYMFKVTRNSTLISDKLSLCELTDDKFFDGSDINGVWVYALDPEEEKENLQVNDTVKLELNNINEVFFDYVNAVRKETNPKSPIFSGAPANVPGNISNGAMGIFTTYAVSRLSVINKKSQEDWDN